MTTKTQVRRIAMVVTSLAWLTACGSGGNGTGTGGQSGGGGGRGGGAGRGGGGGAAGASGNAGNAGSGGSGGNGGSSAGAAGTGTGGSTGAAGTSGAAGATGGGGSAGAAGGGGRGGGTAGASGGGAGGMAGGAGTGGAAGGGGRGGGGAGASGSGGGGAAGGGGTAGGAGAGGVAGAGGSGGSAGAGGGPAGSGGGPAGTGGASELSPPSFSQCVEYDHNAANNLPCDLDTGFGDWAVRSVAFSPNGQLLVSGAEDGRAKVWNVSGRNLTAQGTVLLANGTVYVAFSHDGARLAVGSRSGVQVYRTSNWSQEANLTGFGTNDWVYGVDFTPAGEVLSIDSESHLRRHVVGTAAPTVVTLMPNGTLRDANFVSASPVGGTSVATIVGYSTGIAELRTLDAAGFGPPTTVTVGGTGDSVGAARFSPDGAQVAIAWTTDDDSRIGFWSVPPGSTMMGEALVFPASSTGWVQDVNDLAYSPGGAYIAVAFGGFAAGGSVAAYHVPTRGFRGRYVPTYYVVSTAYSSNGRVIAGGEIGCGKIAICAD